MFNGSIKNDNDEIEKINTRLMDVKLLLETAQKGIFSFDKFILNFEKYHLELFHSDNKKKFGIEIVDSILEIKVGDKTVRINGDGDVV